MKEISEMDRDYIAMIRKNVSDFISLAGKTYDKADSIVLDIAPQDHEGAAPYFKQATVETLDIDKDSGATYIADLCKDNSEVIPDARFDFVVCTEVLEHTLQPFRAADEIRRVLKVGGLAFISTPFNFRIHGPLPDCWRFTEHGIRALFNEFEIVEIKGLELEERFLMPVHYTTTVKKVA